MDYRNIIATSVVVNFFHNEPGEFTPEEIRANAKGFHSDTDDEQVAGVCSVLAQAKVIKQIADGSYVAYISKEQKL